VQPTELNRIQLRAVRQIHRAVVQQRLFVPREPQRFEKGGQAVGGARAGGSRGGGSSQGEQSGKRGEAGAQAAGLQREQAES
jgi:hypothetical protein